VLGIVFGALFGGSLFGLIVGAQRTLVAVFEPSDLSLIGTLTVAAVLPAIAIVYALGDYLATYFIEWVGNRVVLDLRQSINAHLHRLSTLYFTRARTGELISRVINDTSQVERAVSTVLGDLAKQPWALLGAVAALVWLDPLLAAIGLLLFPVCLVPVMLFGRKVREYAREGQQKLADLTSALQESVAGVRIVKAFGMEEYEKNRFGVQAKAVFNRAMRITRARSAVQPIIFVISFIGLTLIFLYVRWAHMSYDRFFTFAIALIALYDPVKKLSKIHVSVQQSSGAADRLFELLDTEVTVRDLPKARVFDEPVRTLSLENVSFSYDDKAVLTNIQLTVTAGECIALVGGSGAGKTTLVSLLPRFFDVTGGRILVNGYDLRDLTLQSLRRQFGIVTQDTFLFNDTVAQNIAYGRADADREAIVQAAKRAQAHEFISAMPRGYDTEIGERGVRLSGGQCQRLAIARALLRNPPILILDEATSALDTESERLVQAALNDLMAGRTVFAIAHRLSTITHADRIVVLEGGRMVEIGTHEELLHKAGVYRRLYDLQFANAAG
jgi:subfamily B ATP-binding cassette protein MsbA